ncbi:hypothetical protein [Sphingomonas sp.]|uniref:hypothetical protein n=1 Tax=Sphingomonas sp. TaxID=28214 RepID=UPI0035BBD766
MNRFLIATLLATAPATAQIGPPTPQARKPISVPGEISKSAPVNGVVVLYGNERCPTDNDGNEVVVCVRRSAQEQFRVPKELREFQVTPQNESWAARAEGTTGTGVGVSSIGSCSVVGAGGQSGCFAQRVGESRRENAARADAQSRVP